MVKAKLTALTSKWINGKTAKNNNVKKLGRPNTGAAESKVKQTIYISKEANKRLWYNRAETGDNISFAVEKLVMKHLLDS